MGKSLVHKFADVIDTLAGVYVREISASPDMFIKFICDRDSSLKLIKTQLNAIKSHCKFKLDEEELPTGTMFQLNFSGSEKDKNTSLRTLIKFFHNLINTGHIDKAANKECGLPDLSLCTVHQMAEELKNRKNLLFALVWIEGSDKDNITLEAAGNATQIVGLLARGQNMAIEWADQRLKFKRKS